MPRVTMGARPTFTLLVLSSSRMRLSIGTFWGGASPILSRSTWIKHILSPDNSSGAKAPLSRAQRRLETRP